MKNFFIVVILLLFLSLLFSDVTLYVGPEPHETIQSAVNYAFENYSGTATIYVYNGVYDENVEVNFNRRSIDTMIISNAEENYNCIIDGNGQGDVINAIGWINHNLEISGFTLRNSGINIGDACIDIGIINSVISKNTFENCFLAIYKSSNITATNTDISIISNNMISAAILGQQPTHESHFAIFCSNIKDATIVDNTIIGNKGGIGIEIIGSSLIQNNDISDNNISLPWGGIGCEIFYSYYDCSNNNDNNIISNVMTNNGNYGIALFNHSGIIQDNVVSGHYNNIMLHQYRAGSLNPVIVQNNLIYNDPSQTGTSVYIDERIKASLINNTLVNEFGSNANAIIASPYQGSYNLEYVTNNIIWGFDNVIVHPYIQPSQDPIVTYNCYNGNLQYNPHGSENFSLNPDFVDDYGLEWIDDYNHSPCINSGNEDTDNDGDDYRIDPDDRDPDNSRKDIGCNPYQFEDRDFKYYFKGWNWDSFPRLVRDGSINDHADIIPVLHDNIIPFETITDIDLNHYDVTQYLYDSPNWNYLEYNIYSTNLYKIEVKPAEVRELTIMGTRMEPDYPLNETIDANEWYWLGYWYPENRNIMDAFSNNWDDLVAVLAEDWAYSRQQRGRFDPEPPIWSPDGKTMEYGKGYIVKFDQPIENFNWSESGRKEDPVKNASSTFFTYSELPEYEPIDIINADLREQIIEIGVFENDLCIGAVVVDEFPVQLLAYTGQEECDELSFQIVTADRSRLAISEYMVYDGTTGNFENRGLRPRNQEYSIISLGPGNSDIVPEPKLMVYQNYPNPFNPETTISFYNPYEQPVELTIYNLKGQKVKQICNEILPKGDHSIIWNGQNENNESVASGFYFYKVKSKSKSCVRKMLLIK